MDACSPEPSGSGPGGDRTESRIRRIGRAEAGHDGSLEYESWRQLIVELIRGPRAGRKCGQGSRTLVL